MNFFVKKDWMTAPYAELSITIDNVRVDSGLLDKEDRIELARNLIDAAHSLIYNDDEDAGNRLADILNENLLKQ